MRIFLLTIAALTLHHTYILGQEDKRAVYENMVSLMKAKECDKVLNLLYTGVDIDFHPKEDKHLLIHSLGMGEEGFEIFQYIMKQIDPNEPICGPGCEFQVLPATGVVMGYAMGGLSFRFVNEIILRGGKTKDLKFDNTPILIAVLAGFVEGEVDFERVRWVIRNVGGVNEGFGPDDLTGGKPLHFIAGMTGKEALEVMQLLLDAGADVNAKNAFNCTPLDAAVTLSNLDGIELLKANGAERFCTSDEQTVTVENRFSLTVPSYLYEETQNPNDDFTMMYSNYFKEFYAVVIEDSKIEFQEALTENGLTDYFTNDLEGYFDLTFKFFKDEMSDVQASTVIDTTINQLPAKLVDIKATVEGLELFYSDGIYEGKDGYYQVMVWTLASERNTHRDDMKKILYSLKELD